MAFPTTSWSLVSQFKDPASLRYREELERLVQLYWGPVHEVIRGHWARNETDAQDLTQEFFERVTMQAGILDRFDAERGSFRTFLRAVLKHFMLNTNREAGRQKRGGAVAFVPIDGAGGEEGLGIEGRDDAPDRHFEAAWKKHVFAQALAALEAQLEREGRKRDFTLFSLYDLHNEASSYAAAGRPFGLTADQVKHTLVAVRAAFRAALVEIVRGYVAGPEFLASELEQLFRD